MLHISGTSNNKTNAAIATNILYFRKRAPESFASGKLRQTNQSYGGKIKAGTQSGFGNGHACPFHQQLGDSSVQADIYTDNKKDPQEQGYDIFILEQG